MSQTDYIKALMEQSVRDREVANDLFASKKYMYCLFFHHLALEKMFKAAILNQGKQMMYVHDLIKLATVAQFPLDDLSLSELGRISDFNIEARYDDYKSEFYHQATEPFAKKWSDISSKYYHLLNQLIHDKP